LRKRPVNDIPAKANHILNLIVIALLLVLLRCWHLSVVQHEDRLEEARKPQRRYVVEPAKRATIRDRFNQALAVNKMRYQAAVQYAQLRAIPGVSWIKDDKGKRVKFYKRRAYIKQLAAVLGAELSLDPDRLEDIIYSKAALYNQLPYVIKEDISEKEYYRLKMLDKDWLGINVRRLPKRNYPMGRVAATVVGYMGAINRDEYERVVHEIKELESIIAAEELGESLSLPPDLDDLSAARRRLRELQDKAYSINDYVGKSGVEASLEETLRGFHGKRSYYSDARGNFLRELPGSRDPLAGQRVILSISAELQTFAEELLIKNEQIRQARVSGVGRKHKLREPWIKGGAVVAMDPNNGEIVALASYPRFDPNDFISSGDPELNAKKQASVRHWFETDRYIGDIWDQREPLQREVWDEKYGITDEKIMMNWENYLRFILAEDSEVNAAFKRFDRIEHAVEVDRLADALVMLTGEDNLYVVLNELYDSPEHQAYGSRIGAPARRRLMKNLSDKRDEIAQIKKRLNRYLSGIKNQYDKVLFIDLCRVAAPGHLFSEQLLKKAGHQRISIHRDMSSSMAEIVTVVKEAARGLFHEWEFNPWREANQKTFLKEKRKQEKEEKRYAKPYLDYFDREEAEMFAKFWARHRWQLLTAFIRGDWIEAHPNENLQSYLRFFRRWHLELQNGAYEQVPWISAYFSLHDVLKHFNTELSIHYLQTLRRYDELDRPLFGKYRHLRREGKQHFEKHLAAAFYPKYGFGFARSHAYRTAAALGSIFKLVTAYEALVQRYQKIGDSNVSISALNPMTIEDRFWKEGKNEYVALLDNGKPVPRYYKGGRLPRSLSRSIGKTDITTALERSSNPYFALLAAEHLGDPDDLATAARLFSYGDRTGLGLPGEITGKVPEDLSENKTGLYSMSIGQHTLTATPLQTAVMLSALANGGKVLEPKLLNYCVGQQSHEAHELTLTKPPYRFQEAFYSVGLDFPLFSSIAAKEEKNLATKFLPKLRRELFMPSIIRRILLDGMYRVVERSQRLAIGSLQHLYRKHPEAVRDFVQLRGQLLGKTSTAESIEYLNLDRETGANKYNSLWFGGISFDNKDANQQSFVFKDQFGKPELVVVVYLRFGAYGKDTGPVAAQIINKWRHILEEKRR